MEKFCRARQATGDNKIQHMRFACWISKATNVQTEYGIATNIQTEYGILIAFPRQQW